MDTKQSPTNRGSLLASELCGIVFPTYFNPNNSLLSNDPGKNCPIFYCSAAIRFPHVEKVLFSDQEFINWW